MYKKHEVNRIISEQLRSGNKLAVAISLTPLRSKVTYYNWMNANPRLKRWVKALENLCDERRTTIVEDAFFKKLKDGTATAAEYIFYLCNRKSERWQNKHQFEHSGKIDHEHTVFIENIVSKVIPSRIESYVLNTN